MTNGTNTPEAERADRQDDKKESEERWVRLEQYRLDIAEDAEAGRISFLVAESCYAVADAIEDLYHSIDAAEANPEASTEARAEGADGSDSRDSEGVEVEGDEVESSEAIRAPARNRSGGTALNATDFPNLSPR